jgi:Zn-dependent M28 family amino/carboxypeptidase
MPRYSRKAGTLLTAGTLALGLAFSSGAAAAPAENVSRKLEREVTLAGVKRHMAVFQLLANLTGGTRASSRPGHDLSVLYVSTIMRLAGYKVTLQEFPFTYVEETRESITEVTPNPRSIPADVMSFSVATPAGGITAQISTNPADTTPGCEPTDFGPEVAGKIVLVKRGPAGCTFAAKANNAAAQGAIGAIVYNNDEAAPDAVTMGTLGAPGAVAIPVAGTSLNAGNALVAEAAAGPVTVTLDVEELVEERSTRNVIAETRHGDASNVVMLGAHLDSVVPGPGINDNGSGSAALIELALQFRDIRPVNKVRFAWWGAEEFGLVGSEYYVEQLTPQQRADISLYLNFDMIGSPNYFRGIYDGDDSDGVGAGPGPEGSAQIEDTFEAFFTGRGLPFEGTDFSGRSDYGPFIAVGIPSGGLFTGAEGRKTPAQVARYGGTAGEQYDPCYHEACDTFANLHDGVLDTNADAIANALGKYAFSLAGIPERPVVAAARSAHAGAHSHDTTA